MLRPSTAKLERRLASVLKTKPEEVRDYLYDVIEERLWRGRDRTDRVTGFRFVRGSHSGRYVRDPEGTDVIPPGVEVPPEQTAA